MDTQIVILIVCVLGGFGVLVFFITKLKTAVLALFNDRERFESNLRDEFNKYAERGRRESTQHMENIRTTVDMRLEKMQNNNSSAFQKIDRTVGDNLQETLDRKLSKAQEEITLRLGAITNATTDVTKLLKVFNNVTSRGALGETQLESLLSDNLSPGQYYRQAKIKDNTREAVDFVIKMPIGTLLPIDSKFPLTDYEKMVDADKEGDREASKKAGNELEKKIKEQAKNIREKYIDPPKTTNFAVMFLPNESLFSEILKRPGLFDYLHREYKVTVAGPITLWALINSLQLGFHSLAMEKQSSEVFELMMEVRSEFYKFKGKLDEANNKIDSASNSIEQVITRTRVLDRKIKKIEEVPLVERDKSKEQ